MLLTQIVRCSSCCGPN